MLKMNPCHFHIAWKVIYRFFHIVTRAEAVARLQGNYAADIEAFDAVHAQAMHMADALSDGIIAQFPQRFED